MNKYHRRIIDVINYIDSHLDDDLSLDSLSVRVSISKFHFHRLFQSTIGINIATYKRLVRFKKASFLLAFRNDINVIDIALNSGYESSEAFSRAFKSTIGQGPAAFRNKPNWQSWHNIYQQIKQLRNELMKNKDFDYQVKIVSLEEVQVACLEHRGSPRELGASIQKFISWRKDNHLPPSKSRTFNLLYDDPDTTSPNEYRFGLCAQVRNPVVDNAFQITNKRIPAGRCAVVRHVGSDDTIGQVVRYLYSDWLIESGEQLKDFPMFFERVSFFPDVPECEMITDVYLSIE